MTWFHFSYCSKHWDLAKKKLALFLSCQWESVGQHRFHACVILVMGQLRALSWNCHEKKKRETKRLHFRKHQQEKRPSFSKMAYFLFLHQNWPPEHSEIHWVIHPNFIMTVEVNQPCCTTTEKHIMVVKWVKVVVTSLSLWASFILQAAVNE